MTAIIDNDVVQGLPSMGTDVGDFLGNLAPGLGKFLLVVAVFVAIAGIIASLAFIIKEKINFNS